MRIDLLEEVQRWIPPFKALMSPHDNPGIMFDWEIKEKALEAAAKGTCEYSIYVVSSFTLNPKLHRYGHEL